MCIPSPGSSLLCLSAHIFAPLKSRLQSVVPDCYVAATLVMPKRKPN